MSTQSPDKDLRSLTESEIEAFRKEHLINGHPDGKTPHVEPWAVEENRILNALCDGAQASLRSASGEPSDLEDAVNIGLAALGYFNTEQSDKHWNEQERVLRRIETRLRASRSHVEAPCAKCGKTPPFPGGTRCQDLQCPLVNWTATVKFDGGTRKVSGTMAMPPNVEQQKASGVINGDPWESARSWWLAASPYATPEALKEALASARPNVEQPTLAEAIEAGGKITGISVRPSVEPTAAAGSLRELALEEAALAVGFNIQRSKGDYQRGRDDAVLIIRGLKAATPSTAGTTCRNGIPGCDCAAPNNAAPQALAQSVRASGKSAEAEDTEGRGFESRKPAGAAPTPRTEAARDRGNTEAEQIKELTIEARKLERELAEARENEGDAWLSQVEWQRRAEEAEAVLPSSTDAPIRCLACNGKDVRHSLSLRPGVDAFLYFCGRCYSCAQHAFDPEMVESRVRLLAELDAAKAAASARRPNNLKICQAVARGWCSPLNRHKEMDADLAFAIAVQIEALLASPDGGTHG